MYFLRSKAEHMGLPSESEQLKEEECADSCADIGDEWVLDYIWSKLTQEGAVGPTHRRSHSFRSLPFISSFTSSYQLGTLQSPVFRELLLWEEGETQSPKQG